ncbi:MAG: efflux transporter outer membrane subunit [Bryobacteraceae bacterium]|jgi:multidrug efflux system outer membrane protein
MIRRVWFITFVSLALTGCLVGPNYKRPQVATPDQFRSAPPTGQPSVSIADTKWFDLFHDDALKQLVTTALERNFDVRIAAERVNEAREQYGIARSQLYPVITLPASFTSQRISAVGAFPFPAGAPLTASYTQATVSLSWEIDLWGRIRRLSEAARAQYLASDEARHGVTLSLVSDVMNNYFTLRELDLELEIGRHTSSDAADNLRLINLRHDRGAANGLDVKQAEQFLYTATAQIAAAERSIGLTEDAINLLLGNAPGEVARGQTLEQLAPPPQLPPGLPSSLIERRPDIRQAEETLIAQNAQIGAARALLFPQISLTGFLGGQSQPLTSLLSLPARIANISPAALQPIFQAGLRAGIRLTEAQQRDALISYQKTIFNGLREVSDALVAHDRTNSERIEQEKLVAALSDSVRLSTLRYRGGLDSYLQVLDAERNLFAGQLALAQLRSQELQSVVQLYAALGGGWQ